MWTSTLDLSPRRVILTRALGWVWRDAYFSSLAPLQVQNVPREQLPGRDWVRVRNRLAGICGSDMQLIYANGDFRVAPAALPGHTRTYPGHEVVGEVIEVGEDVTHVQVGDRVALQYGRCCLTTGTMPMCHACARGDYNLCEQGQFAGPEQIGGGWSEEMLVQEQQVFRVPQALSDEQAVLLEPTSVALHSVMRHIPQADEHVLIMGAGTIGLLILQVIKAISPGTTVSVMARYPFQVEQATRMGAASILYPQDSYDGVVRATGARLYTGMLGNRMLLGGYDAIYDTIGTRSTLEDALRWTRAGGAVVLVGVDLHLKRLDLSPVWYQEVSMVGSMGHGTENWMGQRRSTFAVAAELIEQRLLHPEKLLTHRFALTNFKEAIHAINRKGQTRAIKVVFDYALLPASVVPNVRSSARPRRPARVTTAAWPDQEEKQANGIEETGREVDAINQAPASDWVQPEAEYEPVGRSWVQQVQPFPPVVTGAAEPEAARAGTEENAQAAIPFANSEWVMQGESAEQKPMDDTMLFYTYENPDEQPELTGEEVTQRVAIHGIKSEATQETPEPLPSDTSEAEQQAPELLSSNTGEAVQQAPEPLPLEAGEAEQQAPEPLPSDTSEAEQHEPEPIRLHSGEQVVITPESEPEIATLKIQRPGVAGRKRTRPVRGSAESQVDATKDAPETL